MKEFAGKRNEGGVACIGLGYGGDGMSRYCGGNSGGSGQSRSRIIGVVLMAVGLLVLLLFVPYWVWTSVLAILLISIGFLVWRFNC